MIGLISFFKNIEFLFSLQFVGDGTTKKILVISQTKRNLAADFPMLASGRPK